MTQTEKESACNVGILGWVPGSGQSHEEGNGTLFQYFAWKIPWREESGELQFMGSQRVGHG